MSCIAFSIQKYLYAMKRVGKEHGKDKIQKKNNIFLPLGILSSPIQNHLRLNLEQFQDCLKGFSRVSLKV